MTQYIGSDRVQTITEDGAEKIVLLKSGEVLRVSQYLFEKLVTTKPVEHNGSAKELKIMTIVDEIIVLLTDVYGIKNSDVDSIAGFMQNVAQNNYVYATRLLWSKISPQAGKLGIYGVTLKDVKNVLMENPVLTESVQAEGKRELKAKRAAATLKQQQQPQQQG